MSMLLEALKKSEEQRRLGAIPTLQTPVDDAAVEDGNLQHWLPLALMAVSMLAIAWFGWQQYRPPEPAVAGPLPERPAVEEPVTRKIPAAEPSSVAPKEAAETGVRPEPASGEQARTPVESFQAPENIAETPPQPTRQAADAPAAEQQERLGEPQQARLAEAEAANGAEQEPGVSETEPPDLSEAPDGASPKQAEPHESAPISYWELPQTVRDNLPEFRITVLVYADQSEDRFLLMGGQRLVENETVDGGLVLEEIRREGAVFRYRKYRFLVRR
jgi:general secretion pathway protein B